MKTHESAEMPQPSGDTHDTVNPMTIILWLVAASALGQAIYSNGGLYSADGMVWLTLAAICAVLSLFDRRFRTALAPARRWLPFAIGGAIAFQLRQLPIVCPIREEDAVHIWLEGVALIGILTGVSFFRNDSRVAIGILAVFGTMLGVALCYHVPPKIDVITFQDISCRALLQGENPYAMRMPDVYGPGFEKWYAPGYVKDGFVDTGFCYPPLCLLMALPGYLLGSIAAIQLFYFLACGALMWLMGGSRAATVIAALVTWPAATYTIVHGWTDMYVAPLMALSVYAAIKRPTSWLLPVAIGLLFASKQHIFLLTPLTIMLLPGKFSWRAWITLLAKAALVSLAVTLPFVLWNPSAWWHSVVEFHLASPFRTDALSFSGWMYNAWGTKLSGIFGFAALAIYITAAMLLLPRKPPFFAAATAGAYLFFFAFNKQAFANYYFFIAICFMIAAAASRTQSDAPSNNPCPT